MGKLYYIALNLLGIDNKTLISIINNVPEKELKVLLSPEYINIQFKYNIDLAKYSSKLSNTELLKKIIDKSQKIIDKNRKLNIKTLPINNRLYPYNLKKIDNPPAIIYVKGKNITKKDSKSVACVGTRNPTEFGIRAADSIVGSLVKENFTIISGLAYGIDKQSHIACLKNKGKAVAVLAHGLDMIYPKENEFLAEDTLEKGGTLVSEYPVDTKPERFRFVARNRIVSGLAKGVIVFETKIKSGTMHTVEYALKQNKKVFCPIPIKREEQTLGLIKLLNENKAIGIKTKNNYDIVVKELGYKIKNDLNKISEYKNKNINNIYKSFDNISLDSVKNLLNIKYNGKSGISVNKEVYSKFKSILKENNISLKEFYNAIILDVVKNYKGM